MVQGCRINLDTDKGWTAYLKPLNYFLRVTYKSIKILLMLLFKVAEDTVDYRKDVTGNAGCLCSWSIRVNGESL